MAEYENLGKIDVSDTQNTSDGVELSNVELSEIKPALDKVLKRFLLMKLTIVLIDYLIVLWF